MVVPRSIRTMSLRPGLRSRSAERTLPQNPAPTMTMVWCIFWKYYRTVDRFWGPGTVELRRRRPHLNPHSAVFGHCGVVMRTLLAGSLAAAALSFALAGAPALAAADPTVDQIYEAARAGHLDQAQQLMDQVLRDHPTSSRAHYVQAELYAREGNPGLARSELERAEQLDPGLTKENQRAVQELKSELGLVRRSGGERPFVTGAAPAPHFPWGTVVILALVVGVFWMLFRRRTYAQYPAGVAPMGGGPGYGPGGYAGPGG